MSWVQYGTDGRVVALPGQGWTVFDAAGVPFLPSGGSGAPSTAPYYVTTADGGLSAEVVVPAFMQTVLDDTTQGAARTTLGVGTGDSPELTAVNVGHASDTTLSRASSGVLQVETNRIFAVGGADVPVADGGTGASTAADARTNLGLVIGTDVPAAAHPHPLDAYPIDGTYGDDFTAGSLSGSWTRRNYTSGAETYALGAKATYLRIAKAGRAIGDGYFRTAPAGDWTFAMAFIPRFYGTTGIGWGIAVVDTAGTGVGTLFYHGTPNAEILAQITTYTTYGGAYVQPGGAGGSPSIATVPVVYWPHHKKVWVYLRKSGTNYYTGWSLDGEIWSPESAALVWAGTVDRVAMMDVVLGAVTSGTGTGSVIDVDWFNKIA